jgi:ABC-2 type transport system ATP-binding protein
MEAIQVLNLKKYYGKHLGIENVSFSVKKGEIFGFVGPNGAGKSTTIRILLNFIFSTGGKASICGKDVVIDSREIKKFTGYVPSDVRFYGDMTGKELIKANNGFYTGSHDKEAERLCSLFGLDPSKKFRELSMGNKKKLAIICALSVKPKVLILDEPTNGLDPMMQKLLFSELKSLVSGNGTAVLLSSHNLAEVQEYCDRVAFIKEGKILSITDLSEKVEPMKILTVWGGKELSHTTLKLLEQEGQKRMYRYSGDSSTLLQLLQDSRPEDFTVEKESLQERFLNLYDGRNVE